MTDRIDRPNILLIMDDQHRFDYLGAAGASFVNTPNLDRLAARGTLFTQCASNAPVCAPARIGLASGQQPFRFGSLENTTFLPRSATTYYQRLRDHGYRVGCVGKLDLAKPERYNGLRGDRPCTFGWGFTHPEECEGKMHAAVSDTPIGPYTQYLHERGLLETFVDDYRRRRENGWVKDSRDSALPTDAFDDSYVGRRAARWIETVPDDFPWHLFVSFVGPHDPFDPPAEYAERYRSATMPPPIEPHPEGKPDSYSKKQRGLEPEEVAVTRRQYCAEIELIDRQVGEILDALERRGMAGNTVVIVTSDHGEMLGDHGLYTKSLAYEASMRVPLIVAGPGLPQGKTSDALVELIDVNPTICDLAGLPPQENIDARSLRPVLDGETGAHREDQLAVLRTFLCVRTRTHKLIRNVNDRVELYDLEADPHETTNLADSEPEIVQRMGRRLHDRVCEGQWRR